MKLSNYKLSLGDLVTINGITLNSGGIIYAIVKDNPPNADVVWGKTTHKVYKSSYGFANSYERYGWLNKNGKGKILNSIQIFGSIDLKPVFSFMPNSSLKNRKIAYQHIRTRVKKIDIISLGKSFASFKEFIDAEVKKIEQQL